MSSVARAESPLIKDLIKAELESASFMKNWVSPQRNHRYTVFLKHGDTESISKLQKRVVELCPNEECFVAGVPIVYSEFAREVPSTLLESFLLSLVLVSIVLIWLSYCRDEIKNVHWILLSSFWGPVVMFIIISIFGIKVNFLTCVFASVLVGLTGDNAIQFLLAGRRGKLISGVQAGGGAALVAGSLMAISSLVFLGSYFVPPRIFGLLLMCGFVVSTVGDYWLLKAFVGEKNDS